MIPDILPSKRHRRCLEHVWLRHPTALNISRLTGQTHLCNRQMSKANPAHYSKIIAEHSDDYGSLWKAFNKILRHCLKMHLPDHSSIVALLNTFSSFFINKIFVISPCFSSDSHSQLLNPPDTRRVLQNLSCVTTDEVHYRVLEASCKSSDLDPIHTSLLTDYIDMLITPITSVINLSLTECSFPFHFNSAHVSTLLKNPFLNKDSMNKYQPGSDLSFLSKVLEKVVVNQLNSHINSSKTSNQFQSAYRKFQSTETALLKINKDILVSTDAGKVTALTLLDLSAAFDTIHHTILSRRLDDFFLLLRRRHCRATEPGLAGDIGAIKV